MDGLLKVSFVVPARGSADELPQSIPRLHRYLSERFGARFEIIIVVNPAREHTELEQNADGENLRVAMKLSNEFSSIRIVRHFEPRGKFAALKAGISAAKGQWIFQTDSDLPFAMDFFDEAVPLLEGDFDLIVGNRRRPHSVYVVPSQLLTRFLLRDFLGRMLNLAVRFLMPDVQVADTQAGIKAMTSRFAKAAFETQECPGFYGDIEIMLFAINNEFRYTDLPVRLEVNDSKSSVKIAKEIWKTLYWILRIASNHRRGRYRMKQERLRVVKALPTASSDLSVRDRSIAGQN